MHLYINSIVLSLLITTGFAQQKQPLVAVVGVNVIPMDKNVVLENQTVLIEGELIKLVESSSKVKVPPGSVIIDGKGKYLIPGLCDMHVHAGEREMPLFLVNGVTTVRNLMGDTSSLSLRKKLKDNVIDGPVMYTAGPLIAGSDTRWKRKVVPRTPDEGRKFVHEQKLAGYDFIKVYDGISKEVFEAVMDQAAIDQIPSASHVPENIGLEAILKGKVKSIEHAEKIVVTHFKLVYDTAMIPQTATMIKQAGTWVCPTLAVAEIFQLQNEGKLMPLLDSPEMKYMDASTFGWWRSFAAQPGHGSSPGHGKDTFYSFQLKLTKGLFKAGVPLLAGTDCPNPGMVYGYSLHHELRNMVAAGLNPFEALQTATTNAALFVGNEKQVGMIKQGMRADLVLLEGNPLENIDNTKKIGGVIARGRWYSKGEMEALVAGLGR